jgi:hypothetical protein
MGLFFSTYGLLPFIFHFRRRLYLLLFYAASLGGPHIDRPLPQDSLFGHVDAGGAEDNPGMAGNTGQVKSVFGKSLYTVFRTAGMRSFGASI